MSRPSCGEQSQPEIVILWRKVNKSERQQEVTQHGGSSNDRAQREVDDHILETLATVDRNTGTSGAPVDTTGHDSPRQETRNSGGALDDHQVDDVTHDEVSQRMVMAFSHIMNCLNPKFFNPWAREDDLGIMEVRQLPNLQEDEMSTDSSSSIRSQAANYYGCKEVRSEGGQIITYAKCCLTGMVGNHNQVWAAHLLPHSSTSYWTNALGLDLFSEGVNHFRNIIFLAANIEQAFDRQRLCFVTQDLIDGRKRFLVKILDPDVAHVPIHDNSDLLIGQYEGCQLHFPEGKDPFTRVLKLHATLSFSHAKRMGWIHENETLNTHGSPPRHPMIVEGIIQGYSIITDEDL
jgi:hypothetical protein